MVCALCLRSSSSRGYLNQSHFSPRLGISQLKWLSFAKKRQRLANADTFDLASHGAWGSLTLLARQFSGERLSTIASLGAFITLVAVISDPFSQASVSVELCDFVGPRDAAIPRHYNYTTSFHTGAGQSELTVDMQFALMQGLYNQPQNTSEGIAKSVVCPSGNCTFADPVVTIDMCHSCMDITDKIVQNGTLYTLDGYNFTGNFGALNSGQIANYGSAIAMDSGGGPAPWKATQMWPDGDWQRTGMFDFQGLAYVTKNVNCQGRQDCDWKMFAFDCSLQPCAKTYSAKVSNGRYAEKELSRQYLHHVPGKEYFQLALNRTFLNGVWENCVAEDHATSTNTVEIVLPQIQAMNPLPSVGDKYPSVWQRPECTHLFGYGPWNALGEYFPKYFRAVRLTAQPGFIFQGDGWVKKLWNNGQMTMDTVNNFTEGLAIAVGSEMRRNGDTCFELSSSKGCDGPLPASLMRTQGDMHDLQPCIKVHWGFLSFLAAMLGLELVFFVAVLAASNRNQSWQEDWKGATLPMLTGAVDHGRGRGSSAGKRAAEFYDEAKSIQVQLVEDRGRWAFTTDVNEDV
ncbi:hypothetical protein VHEMI09970 [[Torrubiella] hemipterigena]|uniref:Uncharacterized protein n=1 Tax=[Torrubiella] hemipterigena TaxID=1531966 RepID=A0A0A1THL5_9HYPO|nr:hypothetical protein VHEMI09970 [[Torrubiella] hemipterigena]